MKTRNLFLLIATAALAVVLVYSLSQNLSQYTDFATAQAQPGREVHIVGQWVQRDQIAYDPATDRFTFYLKDSLGTVAQVVYTDPKPANFEQADRVVVIGRCRPDGKTFDAEKILMKCPSKYQDNQLPAYSKPEGQPATEQGLNS